MRLPALATDRLRIRDFTLDDLEAAQAAMNGAFGERPVEERRAWLEWSVRNYPALAELGQPPYGERAVTLRESGLVVGVVGVVPSFGPFDRLPSWGGTAERFNSPEVGLFWATHPNHQRRGYAVEAAGALIAALFQRLNLRRIVATTEYDNAASIGLMRKLGLRIEHNPTPGDPPWFQVVGVMDHPASGV